tara:strand:+ start:2638 stop:3615 length:978 start_codon:yes stop_codon:yes gene_type:complete
MCLWSTPIKTKMVSHIGRIRPCKNINNINLEDCKEYILNGLSYNEYLNLGINHMNHCKNHNISTNDHNISQQSTNIKCKYCDKTYSRIDSLNRHLKTCKEKQKDDEAKESMNELVNLLNKQNNELKEQLEKQNMKFEKELDKREKELDKRDKELDKRDKQIDELIKKAGINNSTITNNIQNNIKLLSYKDTDVSSLTDKDILKCLNHSNMCVPHLIKMIHFDPKKPENHNIYISNLKNGYVMAYDGDKWETRNRDEVITDIIDDKQGLIEERIENWIEHGKKYPAIMKKFERYLEKKENNSVIDKIKEEIKLMLFNNRNLIKTKI